MSPYWEAPLVLVGWVFALVQIVRIFVQYRRGLTTRPDRRALLRAALSATFILSLVLAIAAFAQVAGDNLSIGCPAGHRFCAKTATWKVDGSLYYANYGDGSWVAISRETYIAQVGARLRQAAMFGVICLSLTAFATSYEGALARGSSRGDLKREAAAGKPPQ